ncbi:MAG TPA: GbsR/MarR family transcriptional regulator [Bacilli bacterium]
MLEKDRLNEEQLAALERSRKRVIETIGKNMDLYGVTLSAGHLYGMMFFRDEPMTLDEMVEEMGMSKTSMSTGVRTLVDLKMVNRVWGKGTRKDLYEVEPDWYQTFSDFFVIKWRQSMEMNLSALKKSLRELADLKSRYPEDEYLQAIVAKDTEKLQAAIGYYHWLGRLIDTFESGEIYNLVPKN